MEPKEFLPIIIKILKGKMEEEEHTLVAQCRWKKRIIDEEINKNIKR